MENSRSVEHAVLNNPVVARCGAPAFVRSTSWCKLGTRALASAAEMVGVDDELLALQLACNPRENSAHDSVIRRDSEVDGAVERR
jgi:hypothetical protein